MRNCKNENCSAVITVNHDYCHSCATAQLRILNDHHPRAMKLMNKLVDFLVVKVSEPYALQVMRLIKGEEAAHGNWTDEDEAWASEHVPGWNDPMPDPMSKPRNLKEEELQKIVQEMAEWTDEDLPLPEDEEIHNAHPLKTGDHDLYTEALRLVGAKHSKYALVDLVNWLLVKEKLAKS